MQGGHLAEGLAGIVGDQEPGAEDVDAIFVHGIDISVPEAKVINTFKANLIYDLIARDKISDDYVQMGNSFQYHAFWLRDSALIALMYDLSGYHEFARQVIDFFAKWQQPDGNFVSQGGQFDGWGQTLWIYGQHYQITHDRAFAEKVKTQLEDIAVLRDVQYGQSLDYPTVDVKVDRERAGIIGPDMKEVSKALVPATWSSRFVNLNFWADPNSGVAYQVQVQIPQRLMTSLEDVGNLPVLQHKPKDPEKKLKDVTLRNIAQITEGTAMGEYERYNMQRLIKVRANIYGDDLAGAARQVHRAIAELGPPPPGVTVAVRGQVVPMQEMLDGLSRGLALAG